MWQRMAMGALVIRNAFLREGDAMFGLFGKKKQGPANALDALILTLYGNPPPLKTAKLEDAIQLAHEELLLKLISKEEVARVAAGLNSGPIPYSTHDLALSVALNFFRDGARTPQLRDAQISARMAALGWLAEKKVVPLLVQSFEDTLYKLYKI